jgi:myo-inositol 2-dehydrogenase/D-chiro-inositol 1-dehydrogenase
MRSDISRIALAGFGAWGAMHARAIDAIDAARIVAVYCHSERSTAAVAEIIPEARCYSNYQEMLDQGGFEVVDICVPNHVHAQFAIAALNGGANVFLEKPLGITVDECDRVIDAAKRNGGLVALNHELRVSHQWGKVRQIISQKNIGKVRYQHLSLFRHAFRQGSGGWRYDSAKVGSWILEELVHFFDLVIWYARENGKPVRVTAFGNGTNNQLTDNFSAVLEWADGSVAVLSQCLSGFEHHTLLEVAGEDGGVRTWWSGALDRTMHPDFELKVKSKDGDVEVISIPKSGEVFELEENIRSALQGFGKGKSILPPEEARIAIEVCSAAEKSYRIGSAVEFSAE